MLEVGHCVCCSPCPPQVPQSAALLLLLGLPLSQLAAALGAAAAGAGAASGSTAAAAAAAAASGFPLLLLLSYCWLCCSLCLCCFLCLFRCCPGAFCLRGIPSALCSCCLQDELQSCSCCLIHVLVIHVLVRQGVPEPHFGSLDHQQAAQVQVCLVACQLTDKVAGFGSQPCSPL